MPDQDKQKTLDYLVKYIKDEGFPMEHIDALMKITCLFNECEESEAKIFKFANDLYEEFTG